MEDLQERQSRLRSQIQALVAAGLGQVQGNDDAGTLLHGVLDELRVAFQCEAGHLYLRQERELVLLAARNVRITQTELSARHEETRPLDRRSPAGWAVLTRQPLLVADVRQLGGEPGFDPAQDPAGFRTRSLLAIPLIEEDGEVCGVLELANPVDDSGEPRQLASEEVAALVQRSEQATRAVQAERLERSYLAAVFDLAAGVEAKDEEIAGHVRRISGYSAALARAAGCPPQDVRWIRLASPLHDLGKVGTSEAILYKAGKLTDEEFLLTQRHCQLGWELLGQGELGSSPLFRAAAEIAFTHHERFDGKGYPRGLGGGDIPLAGRIVAIADVFDALTTRRTYKPALGVEQSLRIVRQESARHFDPELVDTFQGIFAEILDVKNRAEKARGKSS